MQAQNEDEPLTASQLLSSLGPEPDVPDRSEGEGIRYTDVHPGKVCVFQADDRALQSESARRASTCLDSTRISTSIYREAVWRSRATVRLSWDRLVSPLFQQTVLRTCSARLESARFLQRPRCGAEAE